MKKLSMLTPPKFMKTRRFKEKIYKWMFAVSSFSALIFLLGIIIILFKEGLPLFNEVSLYDFITGKNWYPTYDPPEFGILPLITATLLVTLGAMFVCIPLGVGSALYLHELAGEKKRAVIKPLIEILFFSSRRRHTILVSDWSSDVCSSDLEHTSFFQAEDGIRDWSVTGVQTCA